MRKCLLIILLIIAIDNVSAQSKNPSIDGVWMGSYYCTQGETGVRLTLTAITDSTFDGFFDFFPICSNYRKDVEIGKYFITGTIDRLGYVSIYGRHWIWRPLDWVMVGLYGHLEDNIITGNINEQTCGSFKVVKQE